MRSRQARRVSVLGLFRSVPPVLGLLASAACGEDASATSGATGSAPVLTASSTAATTATSATATAVVTASAPSSASSEPPTALSGTPSAAPVAGPSSKPTATAKPTTEPTPTTTGTTTTPVPAPEPTIALPTPAAGSADEVGLKIDELYKGHQRFSARFVQKHKQKVSGTEREQKGVVTVERPNKISFKYDAPNKNRIVSDGATLKVYIADDEQMFQQPVKNTEYPGAFGFIMGSGIRQSFEFSFNEKAKFDLGWVLNGAPRSPNPQYEQVLFWINKDKLGAKDPGAVTAVLILDAQGNKNRFELFEAKFPDSVDPTEFTFTPPAGTSIKQ